MVTKSQKAVARKYCANWFNGKCIGCMMYRKDGTLHFKLSKRLTGKDCAVDKGCDYFDNIVSPGVNDGN